MFQIISKILKNHPLTLEELNLFVTSYVKDKKGKEPTVSQLQQIVEYIKGGLFNLYFAAKEYAQLLNYQVITVEDINTKQIYRTDVYEL